MEWIAIASLIVLFAGFLGLVWFIQRRQQSTPQTSPAGGPRVPIDTRPAPPPDTITRASGASLPVRSAETPAVDGVRAATLQAIAALPVRTPFTLADGMDLPILYDGREWHAVTLAPDECILIAGARRRGKGNLLQTIVYNAAAIGPERVHVWVLDAKQGLDYAVCKAVAHCRIYADAPGCDGSLLDGYKATKAEMIRRNEIIAASGGPRNLIEYNAQAATPLPLLFIVCDEIADLPAEARAILEEIARLSGAAGITLAAATQRPTRDVVSGQVQANTPIRISLGTVSPKDTRIVLDLGEGQKPTYEPSVIDRPGIAILRRQGADVLGVVPEMTLELCQRMTAALARRWPKTSNISALVPASVDSSARVSDADVARLFAYLDTPAAAETAPKSFQQSETTVSPVATVQNEDGTPFRNVDFILLARLTRGTKLTETEALKIACGVSPGATEEYRIARAALTAALKKLDSGGGLMA